MPKIKYQDMKLGPDRLAIIARANEIIEEYQAEDLDLTLRQLYYQFVARDIIPNSLREYKKLGETIACGRMAGLIDWEAIVDRTRNVASLAHWTSPVDIVSACASQFRVDKWKTQPFRPEVWIEKDALAGVIMGICEELDVPYFSCRGYTSLSEMWAAGRRLRTWTSPAHNGGKRQTPIILHFGDHDPSGIDMTRDIRDRLETFMGGLEVRRLALNFDQVEEYNPPPNPAKLTDSRVGAYLRDYGNESWELDALDPKTLSALIRTEITSLMDRKAWKAAVAEELEHRAALEAVADRYDEVRDFLEA